MTPRRRMYGTTSPTRTEDRPEDLVFTGCAYSDDEVDALDGITGPQLPDVCTCWRTGEYFPESCNRADHREAS